MLYKINHTQRQTENVQMSHASATGKQGRRITEDGVRHLTAYLETGAREEDLLNVRADRRVRDAEADNLGGRATPGE